MDTIQNPIPKSKHNKIQFRRVIWAFNPNASKSNQSRPFHISFFNKMLQTSVFGFQTVGTSTVLKSKLYQFGIQTFTVLSTRGISTQGKGFLTICAVVNQLGKSFFFANIKQPRPLLVIDCTSPSLCIKISLTQLSMLCRLKKLQI